MEELSIITRQEPGIAYFENFEEIKAYLSAQLNRYRNLIYSEDSLKLAKSDRAALNRLKKALDDRRKEIKKLYMEPYLVLEAQIKELTGMIDEPLGEIDGFIKEADRAAKEEKREEIRRYFDTIAGSLGDLAKPLFDSTAFFDPKWTNATTRAKAWQDAVREKVSQAVSDLRTIQQVGGAHIPALISRYFETLDMEDVAAYQQTLRKTAEAAQTEVTPEKEEDRVTGFKILKITGTRGQMAQLMNQLELLDMEFEELEDGMPGELRELVVPDFDSFVAFDIETTGSFGAANGDRAAEITEIGAVKVINGAVAAREDWLCNPGRSIVPRISRLTHITNEMVANQPPVSEIIRRFAEYTEGLPLVGHNIKSSDLHYIISAANRAGVRMENPFFDTYRYAKRFQAVRCWENVKLETLSRLFGIAQSEAHRAWCDAEANVGVYFKLKELE